MTTKREAQIIIDDKTPSIAIVREFDAPARAVFRAHTEPDLFVQWVGPSSLDSSRVDRWDCRTGGEWRYVSVRNDDEHWFRGCFHEIRPDLLIVQTFAYEPWPDNVSLGRYVFEDLANGRSRLTATSLAESFEARDAFVASGMEVGVQEGFRKLDTLLAH
ncbi:MAG: SRPBCC family protein [Acidobacteriota bacterium]|nr:SRPBCC family protein [Acidobacteriota bacterium]